MGHLHDARGVWHGGLMSVIPDMIILRRLSVAERLRLLDDVWTSLLDEPAGPDSPDWHRDELDKRLAAHDADPSQVQSWREAVGELEADLKT